MSLRDRRKLGVNFISVLRAVKKITEDPEFEPVTSDQLTNSVDFAEAVLEEITSKRLPELVDAGIDIDAILEFIKRILPIIFQLLVLFI